MEVTGNRLLQTFERVRARDPGGAREAARKHLQVVRSNLEEFEKMAVERGCPSERAEGDE